MSWDAPQRWWASRPLQSQIGAVTALVVGLGVALTALAAYMTVSYQLSRSIDEGLTARAVETVSTRLGNPSSLTRQPAEVFLAANIRLALVSETGAAFSPEGGNSAPPFGLPEIEVARGESARSLRTAELGDEHFRVVAVPAGAGYALVLGQSTAPTEEILDRLQLITLAVGAVGVGLGAWAGALLARTALRPVRLLTEAAELVAATGRLDPIEIEGADELARLANTFNTMLRALDQARTRQARLVADAGHELRTPLTSLRTNLDLLAQSDRQEAGARLAAADRADLLSDVRAQIDELSSLVSDLIELSRDDTVDSAPERIDVTDLVRDALARVQRRAPLTTFEFHGEPWPVEADSTMLTRAVTNLLDNAAKYSPEGGTVRVSVVNGVVEVVDDGPGISDADLPYVFDRFYRSSESRGRPGSGLGLAIVRAAAERHGGSVTASRGPNGGAMLRMSLPRASSPVLG